MPCSSSESGSWKNIVKISEKRLPNGRSLHSYFAGTVGIGSSVSFWCDSWLREIPLRILYPNLFRIERDKWVVVSSRVKVQNGFKAVEWNWRSDPSSQAEVSELFQLLEDLFEYKLEGGSDTWRWKGDPSGTFSVRSSKKLLYEAYNTVRSPTIN
ncbi:hypothetical protein HanRHA438_Chr06g0277181 [Helianthus annuus]|nr:hypothetical protein HanRHA438_Chr06g0277181 [Helianthus annuus]